MSLFTRIGAFAAELAVLLLVYAVIIIWAARRRRGVKPRKITASQAWAAFKAEVWRIVTHGDPAPSILMLSLLMVAIGVRLLLPADTFGSTNAYDYLEQATLGEVVWGGGFLMLGLTKLALLGYNAVPAAGPHRLSYYFGAGVNTFMTVVWCNVALGVLVSNPASFGFLTYFALAGISGWSATRRLRQGHGGR